MEGRGGVIITDVGLQYTELPKEVAPVNYHYR